MESSNAIPLSIACQLAKLTREQTLRRIHRGELLGEKILDRWIVDSTDLARFIRDRKPAAS